MTSTKCPNCGLVNFSNAESCKRCDTSFLTSDLIQESTSQEQTPRRTFGKRIIWVAGMTLTIILIWYFSLRITSNGPDFDQRQSIAKAIAVLDSKGFSREAFILNNLVCFRTTDNWWNINSGHHEAYAATNFPFEIVTLYPEFFEVPKDDTERAAILLHEAQHLMGSGEVAALETTWNEKQKLGWTFALYSETKVWENTRELTLANIPTLFTCGPDQHVDCVQ
jgi:hypothetical protein